jgi:hypothetical protein
VKAIAAIFMFIIAFLSMQPIFSGPPRANKTKCCSKMMKCAKQRQVPAKQCDGNSCNPFMACVYGNFFLAEKAGLNFTNCSLTRRTIIPTNDNRLSDNSSDCWHPPKKEYKLT